MDGKLEGILNRLADESMIDPPEHAVALLAECVRHERDTNARRFATLSEAIDRLEKRIAALEAKQRG